MSEQINKRYALFEINLSSLATLLFVLFVGLKLGNVITWSWWWVVSPLWIPPVALFAAWGVIWIIGWLLFRKRPARRNFW